VPTAPSLPAETPADIRAFIECRASEVTLRNGPVEWVRLPAAARGFVGDARPELTIRAGDAAGTASVNVTVGPVSVNLPAAVRDGALVIDTGKLPFWAPRSVGEELRRFVDELNAWFAANGRQLGPPRFDASGVMLAKVAGRDS
jgi:hypothetical protein